MNEIRFDLEDMLEANIVDDVLSSISYMSKRVQIEQVVFWHNGALDEKKIDKFKTKLNKTITIPTKISNRTPKREYVWFDVISSDHSVGSRNRYFYVYSEDNKSDMINGIYNFFNVVTFITDSNQARRKYYKPKE